MRVQGRAPCGVRSRYTGDLFRVFVQGSSGTLERTFSTDFEEAATSHDAISERTIRLRQRQAPGSGNASSGSTQAARVARTASLRGARQASSTHVVRGIIPVCPSGGAPRRSGKVKVKHQAMRAAAPPSPSLQRRSTTRESGASARVPPPATDDAKREVWRERGQAAPEQGARVTQAKMSPVRIGGGDG